MRRALILVPVVGALAILLSEPASAACQCVCRYTPFGKECRRVCTAPSPPVRTYSYAPRPYVPDVSYNTTTYRPTYQQAGPAFPAELVGPVLLIAALGIGFLALMGAIASSGTAQLVAETEHVRTNTVHLHGLTDDARGRTADLDAEMQRRARQSFEQGRRDADEAWRRHG